MVCCFCISVMCMPVNMSHFLRTGERGASVCLYDLVLSALCCQWGLKIIQAHHGKFSSGCSALNHLWICLSTGTRVFSGFIYSFKYLNIIKPLLLLFNLACLLCVLSTVFSTAAAKPDIPLKLNKFYFTCMFLYFINRAQNDIFVHTFPPHINHIR